MVVSNNYGRKQNGYTLIELLLVITVIAVIAALGVKTYRDKAESDRINIAALNIQHVLESAMSYNVANNGMWPKHFWTSAAEGCVGTPDSSDNFVQNYLPNESYQSNFGVPLCWNGDDPSDPKLAQKAPRFWVALRFSSGDMSTAQRIAARLPNAIITNDPNAESTSGPTNSCTADDQPCYVKAVVSIPSASSVGGSSYLAGVGNCDPNIDHSTSQAGSGRNTSCQRTTLYAQFKGTNVPVGAGDDSLDSLFQYQINFQCKPGETPNIYVTPNFVRMDRFQRTSTNETAADPMFQLSGSPENKFAPNPPYYKDYHQYCDNLSIDGSANCKVTMVATYDHQADQPVITVGCTQHMNDIGACTCEPYDPANRYGGCATEPGAIGASYMAMCNPPLSTEPTQSRW